MIVTRCILSLLLPLLTFWVPAPAPDYNDTGPLSLLITYRCEAAKRPAFRSHLKQEGLAQLQKWKQEGVLQDYQLFFNWYVDEGTWDAMAMLRFKEFADVGRWKVIEETMPGGLSQEGLRLGTPVGTTSADIVWQNSSDEEAIDHRDSVFLLIPYKYLGLVSEYKTYVDGYVIPQLDGWLAADTLESYRVLLNRFPTGDRWGSLLVLEYKNLEAFGRRNKTRTKVREGLKDQPEWAAWAKIKRTIREEREPIITDMLFPARQGQPSGSK